MPKIYIPPFIHPFLRKRAFEMVHRIEPFINHSRLIVDIGSGPGYIADILRRSGKIVDPVDIADKSYLPDTHPTIYDGKRLPYKDSSFDVALLVTVLHHAADPEAVLKEAGRVAKKIIIVETCYKTQLQKLFIVIFNTLSNWQASFHWDSFRSDEAWRALFRKEGYHLVASSDYIDRQHGATYFHPMYILEKKISYPHTH